MDIYSFKKNSCKSLAKFCAEGIDGVYYLSHASIMVSLNGKKYLFDPVLAKPPHLGSWLFYPEMKMDSCLLDVDGIFISHQHQDHFDIDFIKLLPVEAKIFIVSGRPQFSKILHDHGISFIEVPENVVFDLGDGVTCMGITHEYNGIDSAITISNGKLTVYHGNDCFVSNEKLKIIKNHYPKINIACIPFGYVHWYPFLLDDVDEVWKDEEANRLIRKYLNYGLSQIEYINPEIAIPFGANMFYFDDTESDHNKAVVSPFDFKEYAIDQSFRLEEVIHTLFGGDFILSLECNGIRHLETHSANMTRVGLMSGLKKYIEYVREHGTGFDAASIENLRLEDISDVDFISKRLSDIDLLHEQIIYVSNSEHPEIGFVSIDLQSKMARKVPGIDSQIPYHWFKLTDLAYKAYFSQKFTFNEIIASSRFRLSRNPNHYDLDVLKILNNIL